MENLLKAVSMGGKHLTEMETLITLMLAGEPANPPDVSEAKGVKATIRWVLPAGPDVFRLSRCV